MPCSASARCALAMHVASVSASLRQGITIDNSTPDNWSVARRVDVFGDFDSFSISTDTLLLDVSNWPRLVTGCDLRELCVDSTSLPYANRVSVLRKTKRLLHPN